MNVLLGNEVIRTESGCKVITMGHVDKMKSRLRQKKGGKMWD